ncbi:GRP family sugar transporter [Niabella yanshanensis]|uniref:GRP family sugar transporter n=1 Tax=Niabella yanshanensis TaxID=577386 RepID=A0ABZ0W8U4_9BACT|nr:GRP family sugar transporter [Niabella yanshanensis]WQD38565.1 GRP family sugar transporter [Niabella yanshanensis]
MFIVDSYPLAVLLCFVTMLCWGSWGNTQKLAGRSWRYELFYWDYVIGVLLFSVLSAFTLGSIGTGGRSFVADLLQADTRNIMSAFIGGVVFNASNILLSAAIAIAGMSVAFPLGVGIALVLGVIVNYAASQKGNSTLLFLGVVLVVIAIILNAVAYKTKDSNQKSSARGILISLIAGILMAFFYRFIAASMDLDNFYAPQAGKMTPYTAVFIFSTGIFISNFLFNTLLMRKPFTGAPLSYRDYFKGGLATHFTGVLGGLIWGLGNSLNLIAAGKAGAAVSYGLGQGATMVAAFWGVFIWKEFKNSPPTVSIKLRWMFLLFIVGLACIVMSGR